MKTIIGLLLLGTLAAPPAAGEDPTPVSALVTPEEVAAVEARVMQRIAEYRAVRCVRPVLRGDPTPGSGAEGLAAFGADAPALQGCFSFSEENGEAISPKDLVAFLETGEGLPVDLTEALRSECGGVSAAVSAAVAHGDVCSPWRPGIKGIPAFLPFIRTSKIAVILGRTAYTSADTLPLARAALDRIRFDQDTFRGGGTLIAAMVGTASTIAYQVPWLRWLLDQASLDEAALSEIVDSLGVLLATEPPVGEIIEADGYWGFLQLILPVLKGSDWTPPGGWDHDHVSAPEDGAGAPFGTRSFIDARTDAAILLVAMDEIQRAQTAACPLDATPLACIDGLRKHSEEMQRRLEVSKIIRAIRVLGSPDARTALRQWIVDILMGVATPAFEKYVEKYSLRAIRIAALRVHAAVLREWSATGACREDFSGGEWAGIIKDPIFDGDLGVTRDPTTTEWIVRPAGTFSTESINQELEYRFHCPPSHAD
ncbi:MAG: hypothetical protein ABIK09_09735 [Pseudomonadota bacterium]